MDSFGLLRKHFAMCGIDIAQNSSKNHPFNGKNLTILIVLCVNISSIAITSKDANTFDKFTDILFRCVSYGTCGIFYVIIIWKTSKLLEFSCSLEAMVNASE